MISCKKKKKKSRTLWQTFAALPLEENGNNYKISEVILSSSGVSLASLLRKGFSHFEAVPGLT